jgi:hypothetical protein
MSELSVFKDIVVPAFAILGVAQLWFIAVYRRLFKRRQLEIIRAGVVEVSISDSGPTVTLLGTIVAINKDSLVSRIEVVLTRKEDRFSRRFKWFAFRPTNINLMDRGQRAPSVPFGFVVTKDAPHFFNISFGDFDAASQMNGHLSEMQDLWFRLVEQNTIDEGRIDAVRQRTNKSRSFYESSEARAIMQPFLKDKEYLSHFAAINELFYWKPGKYGIQMEISTIRPNGHFVSQSSFTLTESQSEDLKLNIVHLVNRIPQTQMIFPPIEYYMALTEYDDS